MVEAEFSDSDGARKPREAEARSASQSNGFQRKPALGEKALPKSLYSSARPATWTSRFDRIGMLNSA
ncbi:hypothetical protein D3C81_2287260 [compost metagenome]